MKLTSKVALTVAACGLASSAIAQDSVAPTGAGNGDALSVYDASESCNSYVLDMVGFNASWGTALQIGPVLKSPRMPNTQFFNNLISAHAISHDLAAATAYPVQNYDVWTVAGGGINNNVNSTPGSVSPTGSSLQFGVTLADFGTSFEGSNYNGVHAAVVNYDAANPSRMYVARASAAVNGPDGTENNAQIGNGVIDANGNAHFRVDDFGLGGTDEISGQNIFRTRILDRNCGTLNTIGSAGGSDATDWLVAMSTTTHVVPNAIPESIAGRPVYGGVTFNTEYGYESSAGTVSYTGTHTGGAGGSRGSNGFSVLPWFGGNAVAAYALQAKTINADTDGISVWDVDNTGAVTNSRLLPVPCAPGQGGVITDNDDGYQVGVVNGSPGWELDGYHSQTPFRGGSGSVAMTVANGDRLVASTVYDGAIGGNDNPGNAIVVGRHDAANNTTEWTLAGYYDAANGVGKEILDGPNGNVIGLMTGLFNVTGGSPLGPSMSQPAFDCAGNVYFVAAAELFGDLGSDFDVCLLRAVYQPATFSYQLELIATTGDVYAGANSATPYSITFVDIADGDSISSGSFYASNVMGNCFGGLGTGDLDGTTDPRALGGLVLNARITYDTDGDGSFDNSLDENYRALLLITGTGAASDPCLDQFPNCDGNDVVNTQDFLCFLGVWSQAFQTNTYDAAADCDGNGTINTQDFLCFLGLFAGCF